MQEIDQNYLRDLVDALNRGVLSTSNENSAIISHCTMLKKCTDAIVFSPVNSSLTGVKTNACRHLDNCYSHIGMERDKKLIELIQQVDDKIYWTEGYNDQTDNNDFLYNFSYGEIVGRAGVFYNDSVSIGLTLIGPELFYPWHFHPAVELYYTFNGPSYWGIDDGKLVQKEAGELILHPSMVSHATRTGNGPLLALWFWTGDTKSGPVLKDIC